MRSGTFALSLLCAARVEAAAAAHPHVTVELIADSPSIEPGRALHAGILFELEDAWHVYWKNPGDSGEAPKIKWTLPPGITAGEIQWPAPHRIPVGPLVNFGYEHSVLLMVPLNVSGEFDANPPAQLAAEISWLVCKEECIPGKGRLTLALPDRAHSETFKKFRAELPEPLPSQAKASYELKTDRILLTVQNLPNLKDASGIFFFPEAPATVSHAANQQSEIQNETLTLSLPKSEYFASLSGDLKGVLRTPEGAFEIAAAPEARTASGVVPMLLLAFAGGLLLNLMPCVFPVLSLKALHFLKQGASDRGALRAHGLLYTAGILVSCWALAATLLVLRAAGNEIGWGFQLQAPAFVAFLASLFFLMGLYLLGVFHWGQSFMGIGQGLASKEGPLGSFMTGVLATVVATPCTAPFMATALGFALTQTALVNLSIFTALALGLAFPYLALSWTPALFRYLPKPGRWMEVFKQVMAFPLFATVLWLSWVLGLQLGLTAVLALMGAFILLGLAAWLWGFEKQAVKITAGVLALMTVIALLVGVRTLPAASASLQSVESGIQWEPYSAQKLNELTDQNKPVFLDFTAAWCITCQANELTALRNSDVVRAFKEKGITALKGDWTNYDAEITRALAQFGRSGVPLYVYYSGVEGEAPRVLPSILTSNIVLEALAVNPQ